jgi:carbon monoxide dehydrogenase subunit G
MRISGENTVNAPVQQVWDALLDPSVLVRTIPGCERLEENGANAYAMTVSAGVAAIKGTYDGTCILSELHEPASLTMQLDGAGAPGTIGATVAVSFGDNGDGTTLLHYDAEAVVGGMIGGVGQRMLTGVSRRMAGEFFGNVERALAGTLAEADSTPIAPDESATDGSRVFTAPSAPAGRALDERSFLRGVAVGAGLVLLGVVAGRLTQRR